MREELSLLSLMAKNTGKNSDVAEDLNPVELGETLENYAERLTIAVELLDRQCRQPKRSKYSN